MADLSPSSRQALRSYGAESSLAPSAKDDLLARIEASIDDGDDRVLIAKMRAGRSGRRPEPTSLAPRVAAVALLAAAAIVLLWNWDRWFAAEEDAARTPPQAGYHGALPKADAVATTRGGAATRRGQPQDESTSEPQPVHEPQPPVTPVEPAEPAPSKPKRPAKAQAEPPMPAVAAPDTGLAREIALMQQARRAAKAKNYDAALKALAAHRSAFPSGQMLQDREALRAQVLCDAGRKEAARGAAAAFVRRFPRSPHATAMKNLCAR